MCVHVCVQVCVPVCVISVCLCAFEAAQHQVQALSPIWWTFQRERTLSLLIYTHKHMHALTHTHTRTDSAVPPLSIIDVGHAGFPLSHLFSVLPLCAPFCFMPTTLAGWHKQSNAVLSKCEHFMNISHYRGVSCWRKSRETEKNEKKRCSDVMNFSLIQPLCWTTSNACIDLRCEI